VLLVAGGARAEPPTALALDYRAPEGCPTEAEFMAELTARTTRAKAASAGEIGLPVRVRIEPIAGGSHGELVLGDARDASAAKRTLSAVDCRQVVAALALMTALAVDPDAATSPEPPPAAHPPPPTPPRAPAPPRRTEASARVTGYAGLGLEATNALSVGLALAPKLVLGVDRVRDRAGLGARLSGERLERRLTGGAGAGEFVLTDGRLEGCLVHGLLGRTVWVSVCGAFEAGALHAAGRSVSPPAAVTRPWLAAGGTARLEARLLPAWGLELGGDLLLPLVRDRFFVDQNATLRRTPLGVAGLACATSVRFP
jgi:hypothetical protein